MDATREVHADAMDASTAKHYSPDELSTEETTRGNPAYEARLDAWIADEEANESDNKPAAEVDPYPEHAKMLALRPEIDTVTEFIDNLGEQGLRMARWDEESSRYVSAGGPEELLALHFGIDTGLIAQEKDAMLQSLRDAQL